MSSARWAGALAGIALALEAGAAGPVPAPASPESAAPPPHYRSAFAHYRPFEPSGVGDWKAVNDRVRDAAGGHGGVHAPGAAPAPGAPAANGRPTDTSAPRQGTGHAHGGGK